MTIACFRYKSKYLSDSHQGIILHSDPMSKFSTGEVNTKANTNLLAVVLGYHVLPGVFTADGAWKHDGRRQFQRPDRKRSGFQGGRLTFRPFSIHRAD
jgi:hypothetical protein